MQRMGPTLLLLALAGLGLSACDQEGPLERSGEKADQAVRDLEEAAKPDQDQERRQP